LKTTLRRKKDFQLVGGVASSRARLQARFEARFHIGKKHSSSASSAGPTRLHTSFYHQCRKGISSTKQPKHRSTEKPGWDGSWDGCDRPGTA